MPKLMRSALLTCALLLLAPSIALAAVQPGQPFPSNLSTAEDGSQLTGLRVALPKAGCAIPDDYAELDELNMLDGFNVDARVSIPFSGPIDLSTLEPDTVFFADRKGRRVRLELLVWTAATNTLQTRCTDRQRAPEGVPA